MKTTKDGLRIDGMLTAYGIVKSMIQMEIDHLIRVRDEVTVLTKKKKGK